MTSVSNILSCFFEAAHKASIIPFASDATIYAMKAFGNFPMLWPIAAAIVGAACGHSFNWWLGNMIMKLPAAPTNQKTYRLLAEYFKTYGFPALLLAPLPLGNILVIAGGMLGVSYKKTMLMVITALFWYYGRMI